MPGIVYLVGAGSGNTFCFLGLIQLFIVLVTRVVPYTFASREVEIVDVSVVGLTTLGTTHDQRMHPERSAIGRLLTMASSLEAEALSETPELSTADAFPSPHQSQGTWHSQ